MGNLLLLGGPQEPDVGELQGNITGLVYLVEFAHGCFPAFFGCYLFWLWIIWNLSVLTLIY